MVDKGAYCKEVVPVRRSRRGRRRARRLVLTSTEKLSTTTGLE
jgi:hypothetical protein